MEKTDKIIFTTEDGEDIAFYIMEQTRIGGVNYLLVVDTDDEEEEANAMILKEVVSGQPEDEDIVYDVVENEEELEAVSKVFEQLVDDIEFELDK